jgi:hypothetical protein
MSEPRYTADQVATAARELRAAAGAGEELFTPEQVLAIFTDDRIADLFQGIDIEVAPQQIANAPGFS